MRGARLTNVEADFSGLPDGLFFSHETLQASRLRLIAAPGGGWDELEGSPDMVLEVVSRSSAKRDMVTLREAYWKAGIREYWDFLTSTEQASDRRGQFRKFFSPCSWTKRGCAAARTGT